MAICHSFYTVTLKANFIVLNIDWNFTESTPFIVQSFSPIHIKVEFLRYKTMKDYTIVKAQSKLYHNRRNFLNGRATFFFTQENKNIDACFNEPKEFRNLDSIADPEDLQLTNKENVLITKPEYMAEIMKYESMLVVDLNHKFYFDHPNTHIPGILLLDAGRQMAIGSAKKKLHIGNNFYGDFIKGKISFTNFASFHPAVYLESEIGEVDIADEGLLVPTIISFSQNNIKIGTIESLLSFGKLDTLVKKSIYHSEKNNIV